MRFNRLLEDYAVALHVSDRLMDSGLIEKKIKIKDHELFTADLVSRLAFEIRDAKRRVKAIINKPSDALVIADAYFIELSVRGLEWEQADLRDLFEHFHATAKARHEHNLGSSA